MIDGNGNRAELVYDGHGRQNCWMFPSTTRAASFNDATQATALASAGALSGTIAGGHCASGNFEAYEYDPEGNRTNLRKRDGRYILYAYDHLNRVTDKTYPQGGATPVYYSYDLRNLQLSARFDSQSGAGVANAYDGFGRQRTSTTDLTGPAPRMLSYGYDANGSRTRLVHPDGALFNIAYDGLNRPYYLFHSGWSGMAYVSYSPFGGPGAMGHAATTSYGYDGVQRPASLAHNFSGGTGLVTWTYGRNPAGQLSSIARDNDAFAWTRHYGVQRPYTTNGRNQYSAAGPTTLTYDDNGNLISETTADVTRAYTYDIENRLIGASVPGGAQVQLGYDPLGRLSWTTGSPNFTRFLYDGDALVAEYDYAGTLMIKRYAHWVGADVPLVSYEGASLENAMGRWLIADHQGSIIAAALPSGATAWVNTYDEYGIRGAGNQGRFQYTGQIWLPELGMYHYKARVYSPTLGRFLQTDPVGYDDQFNLYAYVGNDPVNQTDPSGTRVVWSYQNGGTRRQRERGLTHMNRSRTFRREFGALRDSREVVRIIVDPTVRQSATRSDNTILWNPIQAPVDTHNRAQSPALTLGHEVDHESRKLENPVQYDLDRRTHSPLDPGGSIINWTVNEDKATDATNQMARELGEPTTANYGDNRGVTIVDDPDRHSPKR